MFRYFDLANDGIITIENIKETFARCGNHITKQQVSKMIQELDPNVKMTEVTLETFINLMSEENFVIHDNDCDSDIQSARGKLGEGRKSTQYMSNVIKKTTQYRTDKNNSSMSSKDNI